MNTEKTRNSPGGIGSPMGDSLARPSFVLLCTTTLQKPRPSRGFCGRTAGQFSPPPVRPVPLPCPKFPGHRGRTHEPLLPALHAGRLLCECGAFPSAPSGSALLPIFAVFHSAPRRSERSLNTPQRSEGTQRGQRRKRAHRVLTAEAVRVLHRTCAAPCTARISRGARRCAPSTSRSGLAARDASDFSRCRRGFGAAAAGPRRTQPRSVGCGCTALCSSYLGGPLGVRDCRDSAEPYLCSEGDRSAAFRPQKRPPAATFAKNPERNPESLSGELVNCLEIRPPYTGCTLLRPEGRAPME